MAQPSAPPGQPAPDAQVRFDAYTLEALGFLVLFLALAVLAWRHSVRALCCPQPRDPIEHARLEDPALFVSPLWLVIFPLFLALAALGARPRIHTAIVVASTLFLGLSVVQWALSQWVA